MIRVADFIAQTLVVHGINHAFLVTGGELCSLGDSDLPKPLMVARLSQFRSFEL
jgi:hypothetical protein